MSFSIVFKKVVILTKIRLHIQPPHFLKLAFGGADDVLHADDARIFSRQKRGAQSDVFDVAAGNFEFPRQEIELDVLAARRFVGEDVAPDPGAIVSIRKWNLDDKTQPAGE